MTCPWVRPAHSRLAHLVHVDERIEATGVDTGEGTVHRETLTLVAEWCGRDANRRAVLGLGTRGNDARQDGPVVNGDGRHIDSSAIPIQEYSFEYNSLFN